MKLRVKEVGPFDDVEMELADLTVIIGLSGSGKGLLARAAKVMFSDSEPFKALQNLYDHLEPPKEGYLELEGRTFDATKPSFAGEPFGKGIFLSERRFVVPLHATIRRYSEKLNDFFETEDFNDPLAFLTKMMEEVGGEELKELLLTSLRPSDYEASALLDKVHPWALEKTLEMFGEEKRYCTGALSAYLILSALEEDYDLVAIDEPEALLNPGRAVKLIEEIVKKAKEKRVVATAELGHAVAAFKKFSEREGIRTKAYAVREGELKLLWEV